MENSLEQTCTAYRNLTSCYSALEEHSEAIRCSEKLLEMRLSSRVSSSSSSSSHSSSVVVENDDDGDSGVKHSESHINISAAYTSVASAHRCNGDLHQVHY